MSNETLPRTPDGEEYISLRQAAWELDVPFPKGIQKLVERDVIRVVFINDVMVAIKSSVDAEVERRATVTLDLPPVRQAPKPKPIPTGPPVYRQQLPPANRYDDEQYMPQGQGYVIFIPPSLLREVNEYLNSKGIITQNYERFSKAKAWAWQQAYIEYEKNGKPFDPVHFFALTAGTTPVKWYSVNDPHKPLLEFDTPLDESMEVTESES